MYLLRFLLIIWAKQAQGELMAMKLVKDCSYSLRKKQSSLEPMVLLAKLLVEWGSESMLLWVLKEASMPTKW